MSIITKQEWTDWKVNPVTKAFFQAANIRIEDAKDILAQSAGLDQISDNFNRGFIAAYVEMFDFRIEDLDETSDED